jgi:hypothetical protein
MKRGERARIIALAGSGKTWTVSRGAAGMPAGTAYLAFGKRDATDLQRKVPPGVEARTTHSLGYGALQRAWGRGRLPVHEDRFAKLRLIWGPTLEPIAERRRQPPPYGPIARLWDLARAGYPDADPTDPATARDLADLHGINLNGWEAPIMDGWTTRAMDAQDWRRYGVDFADMLYLPLAEGLEVAPRPGIVADEAQDWAPVQIALAKRALADGGPCIAVGDPNQAIYAWRGAASDSMDKLAAELGLTRDYPLTVSWRCPVRVAKLAQRLVPAFEARPGAPEGSVRVVADPLAELAPGDLALSRTNAPLLKGALRLIRNGVAARVLGTQGLAEGLLRLMATLERDHGARWPSDLAEAANAWLSAEEARLARHRFAANALADAEDRAACLVAAAEGARTLRDVADRIRSLVVDGEAKDADARAVTFSSVHRAKGAEARHVAILAPENMPHPRSAPESPIYQEDKIAYVAVTRSLDRLTFQGQLPGFWGELSVSEDGDVQV